ncbi:MAG TPA: transglutaminase family protein [Xanthobacteraceae bacterium]|jgi:transglutaminase-like putative cysteine protease|nr:transglutaminase family protein [Xanthobacteraceae bacterium]
MRLRVAHRTDYRYDPPATGVIQILRISPRNHEGQYVVRWRIDVSADARLNAQEDAFGNISHVFSADGPLDKLSIEVDGEVETQSTNGIVRGTMERFGPSLFLRDTALTQADTAIQDFAKRIRTEKDGELLAELHAILDRLHEDMTHETDDAEGVANAAEAFAKKRGTSRDLSHIFIGAAHTLGIPARFVAGYYRREGGVAGAKTGHAWAEAFLPELGWVAFDPSCGFCPTDAHIRVAIGLDSLGTAPARGVRYGVGSETLETAISVDQ